MLGRIRLGSWYQIVLRLMIFRYHGKVALVKLCQPAGWCNGWSVRNKGGGRRELWSQQTIFWKRKNKDKIKRSVSFHTHSLSKYISYITQQFTEDHLKCFCCVEISSAATNLWIFRISNWFILQILKEVALWPPAHRDDRGIAIYRFFYQHLQKEKLMIGISRFLIKFFLVFYFAYS